MQNQKIRFLIETAMCGALAIILDTLPFLSFKLWAQGGSISFAMLPIFLMAFRWGFKGGLINGFLFGMLQLATGFSTVVHPIQGAIDYFIAFTAIGFAGLLAIPVKNALQQGNKGKMATYITIGVFLGSLGRYIAHTIAGVVFFSEYAEGAPVLQYSLIYNGTYMGPSFVLCSLILITVLSTSPRLTNTLAK